MYLNIGGGAVIDRDQIVGIFDLDNTSQSVITREFLRQADKSGQVINAAEDIPKSFLVVEEKNIRRCYLSQMAASTLLKRSESESLV